MTFRIAFKALGRNKMRTALTMLGMIIGVSAVITLVAMGNGATAMIEDQIKGAGTNMITVNAGNASQGGVRGGAGTSSALTPEDADAIRDEVPGVQYLAAGIAMQAQVVTGNQNWYTRIQGTDVDLPMIRAWPTSMGSFFSPQDVAGAAKVAVLGKTVNDTLFGPDADSVGPGHSHPQSAVQGRRRDGRQGPERHGPRHGRPDPRALYDRHEEADGRHVDPRDPGLGDERRADEPAWPTRIAILLRTRHEIAPGQDDDFFVRTAEEIADIRTAAMGTMTTLLAGIAGVSLIVGGIGIMNIMLVSVTERTREIGLRMAIGAKGRDVLLQFLVEAIALSLVGGGIGIALGFGLAEGLSRWMGWPAKVPPNAVAMAFGFAAATGVFFGFYPARKAARLDPIDALRFE